MQAEQDDGNQAGEDGDQHEEDDPGGAIGGFRRGLRDAHGVNEGIRDEKEELHMISMLPARGRR